AERTAGPGMAAAQPGRAPEGVAELPALPGPAAGAAAHDRPALPAVPGHAAGGAAAPPAELRDLSRPRPEPAPGVHGEVPALEVRSTLIAGPTAVQPAVRPRAPDVAGR